MSGFLWRRLSVDDEGISLVEVLVGIMIIGIALTAFASTLTTALHNITRDEQFVRANQLAAEAIERSRNLDFATAMGFYDDDGAPATVDGLPTVILGPTRNGDLTAPVPTRTVNRDGIDYLITTDIVWIDDPDEPGPENYKQMRVRMDWEVQGRAYDSTTTVVRYDTPDELEPCVDGEIVSMDISPAFVVISSMGTTTQAVTVTVITCSPSAWVTLEPEPLTTRNMTADDTSNGTIWRIDDFPVGTTTFSPGEYTWTVNSSGLDGADSATAEIQFVQEGSSILQIVDLELVPTPICVDTNDQTQADVVLTAHITGASSGDDVEMSWTGVDGGAAAPFIGNDVSSNGLFRATIPAGHAFTDANTTITVSVTRTSDGLNVSQPFVADILPLGNPACP